MKTLHFTLIFIMMVPVGTLTHESAHWITARYFGNHTELHYASVSYHGETQKKFLEVIEAYSIDGDSWSQEQKQSYKSAVRNYILEGKAITLSGPLQTLLTGLIGCLILLIRRKSQLNGIFTSVDWLAVFLTLFLSRFAANATHHFIAGFLGFKSSGDEDKLASLHQVNPNVLYAVLWISSVSILSYLTFKIIPKDKLKPFLIGGALGCSIGWVLWMYLLGPFLLP
jgi:hypothetical protein